MSSLVFNTPPAGDTAAAGVAGAIQASASPSLGLMRAFAAGQGSLRLTSQQPWEPEVEPAETFDCAISVN